VNRSTAAEEGTDFLDRTHRGGQADPLGGSVQQGVQPLQGQREVRAALGGGDRVHLVNDHGVDSAQRLSGR
jgi:hypothetical protein